MLNLFGETKMYIEIALNRSENDVMFVGSDDGKYRMSWEKFKENANFYYDDGYGSQEIASDLIVYFKDGSHMYRVEYDGSECWTYNEIKNFKGDDEYEDFDLLKIENYYPTTIEEINSNKGEF